MTSCVFPGYSFVGGFQAEGKFFYLGRCGSTDFDCGKNKVKFTLFQLFRAFLALFNIGVTDFESVSRSYSYMSTLLQHEFGGRR